MQPQYEVAGVLNAHWYDVQSRMCGTKFNTWQLRTLHAVMRCRTAALGAQAACAVVIKEQLPQMAEVKNYTKEIYNPLQCPCCKKQTMQTLLRFNRRGPPEDWKQMAKNILQCIV